MPGRMASGSRPMDPPVGRVQGRPAAAHGEPRGDARQRVAGLRTTYLAAGLVPVTGAAATFRVRVRMTSWFCYSRYECSPGPGGRIL